MTGRGPYVIPRAIVWPIVILGLLLTLLPIFWMISTAVRSNREIHGSEITWWPENPTPDAFNAVLSGGQVGTYLLNTTVVAASTTIVATVLALLAAYSYSRFRFRGRKLTLRFMLLSQMLPEILLIVPLFVIMARVGLVDTLTGLIVCYVAVGLPFCTWMLTSYVDAIPRELDESAMIDGCSRLQALWHVIAPSVIPGIGVTAFFCFLLSWNQYVFPAVLINDESRYVASVGISFMMGEFQTSWNEVMAAAAVVVAPVVVVAMFLQRYLARGVTAGAVKG